MLSFGNDQSLINQVKEYAGLFFSPKEIAILLKINIEEFEQQLRNENSEIYQAYHLGKLESQVTLRRETFVLAEDGSPAAVLEIIKFKSDQELSETEL